MHFKTNKYKSRKWPVIYWFSLSALFMNVHKHSPILTNVRGHSQTFTDIYELSWTFKNVTEYSRMLMHIHRWIFMNVYKCSRMFLYIHKHLRTFTNSQTFVHFILNWDKARQPPLNISDEGSQYRCRPVGRGNQPPSIPQPPSNTQTYTNNL